MTLCMHDRYYIPEDDNCYPDDWDWKVEQYTLELLFEDYNWQTQRNWYEGVSECGCPEEYPTPSHAPMELVQKVQDYWYDIAFKHATDYYEENPHAD